MNTISVKASENYNILIGNSILPQIGTLVSEIMPNRTVAIISDTNVWPLYGHIISKSLLDAGFSPIHMVFPAGEASKNIDTYLKILTFLADNKVTRTDLLVALGGGVVGDITGFAAATYLRGISYIQIPTSLLAMVDSSVGGKTAIDLPVGKNLVGAFKQPRLVLCDVDTLNTLPRPLFLDGCAEIIKYAMIYDSALFASLMQTGPAFDCTSVITKCVSLKRNVVQEDEFDIGMRQKLNFGHTIGHAIEVSSNYQLTHGQAVAAGMAIVTKAACRNNICQQDVYGNLIALLQKFSLPTKTDFSAEVLFLSALSDKKRSGDTVNLVIPNDIGRCEIVPVPVSELEDFIKAGL